jgi:hypothetical protein
MVRQRTEKHIRCARCRFVRPDPRADEPKWAAFACGNPQSEYCRALVNVSEDGEKQARVRWEGCAYGESGQRGDAR